MGIGLAACSARAVSRRVGGCLCNARVHAELCMVVHMLTLCCMMASRGVCCSHCVALTELAHAALAHGLPFILSSLTPRLLTPCSLMARACHAMVLHKGYTCMSPRRVYISTTGSCPTGTGTTPTVTFVFKRSFRELINKGVYRHRPVPPGSSQRSSGDNRLRDQGEQINLLCDRYRQISVT